MRLIAGMMSGTSADGIDVAIVDVSGRGTAMKATLLHHHPHAYHVDLRQAIFAIRGGHPVTLQDLVQVGRQISLAYADAFTHALEAAKISADRIAAIAAHGQTIFHAPPDTLQWLDPALLAARTQCAVVSDFRRADCAAGGQGAPLVPFADYLLFRDPIRSRVLLNIGGIANLTHLPAGAALDEIRAFDTGPGNCLSDHLCRASTEPNPGYDEGGRRALLGRVCQPIFAAFLTHPYLRRAAPKSTDGPEMIAAFIRAAGERLPDLALNDQLATATAITAQTILDAVAALPGSGIDQLIVSGGGTQNAAIMQHLAKHAAEARIGAVLSADALGVPSAAKEAIAFALLGAATLDNEPANVPSATGASRGVVLGSITPRP